MRIPSWLAQCAPRTAPRALAWYVVLTLAFTWPLLPGLTRDVARDLGDPLLNCWILGWNAEHFLRALRGDPSALAGLWHGNIFHPEPYTLGYSELLVAPALQILPVYALTSNLVLCYNLLFLSTFAVSGLGMFLLARGYTGSWQAAFLAGLLFAFAPYRVNQAPHLQVMSSHWMPFALHGFHRFVETRRYAPAIGGALALAALNLSCGYYLIYFALFVPVFVVWTIAKERAWGDRRIWIGFTLAVAVVATATLPMMQPYLALRDREGTQRPLEEIEHYSADTWSWLTADQALRFWGTRLRLFPKPEGDLFPGTLPVLLAAVAVARGGRRAWRAVSGGAGDELSPPLRSRFSWRQGAGWLALGASVVAAMLAALRLAGAEHGFGVLPREVLRLENHLVALAVGVAVLLIVSRRVRGMAAHVARSPLALALALAAVAWYLSLGPNPHAGGASFGGPRLYLALLSTVPGLDGLRVAARFAMITVLFLSLAAAWGVRDLLRLVGPCTAGLLLATLSVVWLIESWAAPMPVNAPIYSTIPGVADPPTRVPTGNVVPPLARFLRGLPESAVLLAFPFAAGGWEMYHVYYSTLHWRPLVNGFSGYTPDSHERLAPLLRNPGGRPQAAWQALLDSGATHIVVFGQAYVGRLPPAPHDWLEQSGARQIAEIGQDRIYEVPR